MDAAPAPAARANGAGRVKGWPLSRADLTAYVEFTCELTGDWGSAAGFRTHIRQLCVSEEGWRRCNRVLNELKLRLSRGENIPPGSGKFNRGGWVTRRFMRHLKDLGRMAEQHRGARG